MAGAVALALAAGCSLKARSTTASPASAAASPEPSSAATPAAKIQITYAHPNDTLKSLKVTQFTGATLLLKEAQSDGKTASLVRFDGGAPIWAIRSGQGVLGLLSSAKEYRPVTIEYGKLPTGYVQEVPDDGPPAPLDPGSYYVFRIERASGSTNYEVIKVDPDGTVEGYDAEPRAGTSYSLCCNVPESFLELNPAPDANLLGP
jgi:hypothetical protein